MDVPRSAAGGAKAIVQVTVYFVGRADGDYGRMMMRMLQRKTNEEIKRPESYTAHAVSNAFQSTRPATWLAPCRINHIRPSAFVNAASSCVKQISNLIHHKHQPRVSF